jgi:RNA polymerase sigma factor (sigma-70 family)
VHTNYTKPIFEQVIQQHRGILFKVANTYCHDVEDRKDLLQEMMIQLWRSFERYNGKAKLSTWMYTIALNVAISFYRKHRVKSQAIFVIDADAHHLPETEISADKEQQLGLLEQFISELKELDKALILLYLDEKPQKEIAEIMGISETNVATKIGRIKEKLRQRFATNNN